MIIQKRKIKRIDYLKQFGLMPDFNISVDFEQTDDQIEFSAKYKLYQNREVPFKELSDTDLMKTLKDGSEHFNYLYDSIYKKMLQQKSYLRCLTDKTYAKQIKFLEKNIDRIENEMISENKMIETLKTLKEERNLFLNEVVEVPDLDLALDDVVWAVVINPSFNIQNTDECPALTLYQYKITNIRMIEGKFQGVEYIPYYTMTRLEQGNEQGEYLHSYREIGFSLENKNNDGNFEITYQKYNKLKFFLNKKDAVIEFEKIRSNIISNI